MFEKVVERILVILGTFVLAYGAFAKWQGDNLVATREYALAAFLVAMACWVKK